MKIYTYNHNPIDFDFKQTIDRFFVEEIPLIHYNNHGNFLILKIKKRDMSTWKLIHVISKATGLHERDIGYAGLKDKSATTIQYISIPKTAQRDLKNLRTEKIEILEQRYSKAPIKIGQLKGNRFSIVLYQVSPQAAKQIEEVSRKMLHGGIPNYFGYQRFGEDSKSHIQGQKIAQSGKRLKGAKEKLLVSAYQSHLFNSWLSSRVRISKIITSKDAVAASKELQYPQALVKVLGRQRQFFKLFLGDLLSAYPYGKSEYLKDMFHSSKLFENKKITPTGLICGSHAKRSQSDAYHLESNYDDDELSSLKGDRRYAWIWPEDVACSYESEKRALRIDFALPKGSYATTFLEEIGKSSLKDSMLEQITS